MKRILIGWFIGTFIAIGFTVLTIIDAPPDFTKELTDSGFFVIVGFAGGFIGVLAGLATNHVHH